MREMTEELMEMETNTKILEDFEQELTDLINKHCLENWGNIPDFVIAKAMMYSFYDLNTICEYRDDWYGVHLEPGNKYFKEERRNGNEI